MLIKEMLNKQMIVITHFFLFYTCAQFFISCSRYLFNCLSFLLCHCFYKLCDAFSNACFCLRQLLYLNLSIHPWDSPSIFSSTPCPSPGKHSHNLQSVTSVICVNKYQPHRERRSKLRLFVIMAWQNKKETIGINWDQRLSVASRTFHHGRIDPQRKWRKLHSILSVRFPPAPLF